MIVENTSPWKLTSPGLMATGIYLTVNSVAGINRRQKESRITSPELPAPLILSIDHKFCLALKNCILFFLRRYIKIEEEANACRKVILSSSASALSAGDTDKHKNIYENELRTFYIVKQAALEHRHSNIWRPHDLLPAECKINIGIIFSDTENAIKLLKCKSI